MSIIPYSVREGFAGFQRAKFAVFTSTSAMAVALILIGLFGLLSYQAQQVSDWLRQRVGELEIFLQDTIDTPMARALHERAGATLGVDGADYISQEEATRIFQEEFGDGAEIFLSESFLPSSIKVRIQSNYANPDSLHALIAEFESWNRVDEVVFNEPLLAKVQENLRLLNTVGLALGIIVILASLFLVANTIRLTIYARRLLIRTMKLVGATDSFIRRPFLVEGVMQGILAGIVASLVVWALFTGLGNYLPQMAISGTTVAALLAGVVVCGALLGWLGSLFAVRRFIRTIQLH
ncbi:MAG: ABC transporter permease [Rhodothermales bacterium]|nr:ABC transporter permease [Rhodothermales bacterium]